MKDRCGVETHFGDRLVLKRRRSLVAAVVASFVASMGLGTAATLAAEDEPPSPPPTTVTDAIEESPPPAPDPAPTVAVRPEKAPASSAPRSARPVERPAPAPPRAQTPKLQAPRAAAPVRTSESASRSTAAPRPRSRPGTRAQRPREVVRSKGPVDQPRAIRDSPPRRIQAAAVAAPYEPTPEASATRSLAIVEVILGMGFGLLAVALVVSSPYVAQGALAQLAERRFELVAAGLSLLTGVAVAFLLAAG
jgi:hypothetical protein